ncbi:hypothetical protein [Absidia glauca]|uniref:ENTH domain-containing protein n=1 Tax=Absidia glauca TaxID=4829 RepID=A0A168SS06_ABSGL|nr:hypothetical protein [Absidia glauca]
METAVRKATRLDYNPPKQKHLSGKTSHDDAKHALVSLSRTYSFPPFSSLALVSLTFHNPAIIGEMLDLLERRHRENSWIMSFKVLVIIHVLMRQGNGDRTISHVESHPACLDTTRLREKSSGVIHIQNIYLYTSYLQHKVAAYRELQVDYIKHTMATKVGRLRRLTIKDGLLKETMVLQNQVTALLKCKFILDDVDNTISVFAFRLVVEDLLILFQAVNEGVVNILEHYFAMSKPDARLSLEIYKRFAKQTEEVTLFLNQARQFQREMQIAIPSAKHAPLSLAAALEEYLNDLDNKPATPSPQNQQQRNDSAITPSQPVASEQPKELLDFFSNLESDQTPSPATTPQPSLHNPFRNTIAAANSTAPKLHSPLAPQPSSIMMDLSLLAQPNHLQQQPMPLSLPSTQQQMLLPASTSTPLPASVNPFRMPSDMSPSIQQMGAPMQQPSQQLTLFQQQVQNPMPTGFTTPTPLSNPFTQQQHSLQVPQLTGMNPFGMSLSSPSQHQQQQQPWGSSSVF